MPRKHDTPAPPPLRALPAGKPEILPPPPPAALIKDRLSFTTVESALLSVDSVADAFRCGIITKQDVDTFMGVARTAASLLSLRKAVAPAPGATADPDSGEGKPPAGPFKVFERGHA